MTFAADKEYCYEVCGLYKINFGLVRLKIYLIFLRHPDYFVSKIVLFTFKIMRLRRRLSIVNK